MLVSEKSKVRFSCYAEVSRNYLGAGSIFTDNLSRGVLVLQKFGHFSCKLKETGSSGATESDV